MDEKLLQAFNLLTYGYQGLHPILNDHLPQESMDRYSRFESARSEYIKHYIDFNGLRVLDIGGNTGFFSFESVLSGASHVDYYEGDKYTSDFMKSAIEVSNFEDKITVNNRYYSFNSDNNPESIYDVCFLLNVIHHIGGRSGDKEIEDMNIAKDMMLEAINALSKHVRILVFQMGFNWKGNISHCLFPHGTKEEMIHFLRLGLVGNWRIQSIGIAEKSSLDTIKYSDCSTSNIGRDDTLGEFLNRPLFILQSQYLC